MIFLSNHIFSLLFLSFALPFFLLNSHSYLLFRVPILLYFISSSFLYPLFFLLFSGDIYYPFYPFLSLSLLSVISFSQTLICNTLHMSLLAINCLHLPFFVPTLVSVLLLGGNLKTLLSLYILFK